MPKLTLSMDDETIALAKELAAESNTSVSALFARMVRAMHRPPDRRRGKLGPIARKASGLIQLDADEDYRDILADHRSERYERDS